MTLLTINGWILMHRKVTGGSVSFDQKWAKYRDGFGSATDNDNYWLGLEKIYRLAQLGKLRLRIEVKLYLYVLRTIDSFSRPLLPFPLSSLPFSISSRPFSPFPHPYPFPVLPSFLPLP